MKTKKLSIYTCLDKEDQAGVKVLRDEKRVRFHGEKPNIYMPIDHSPTYTPHHPHFPSFSSQQ